MADITPSTPAAEAAPTAAHAAPVEVRTFVHDIAIKAYAEALQLELKAATKADHKAAIKAELDAIAGARAVRPRDVEKA